MQKDEAPAELDAEVKHPGARSFHRGCRQLPAIGQFRSAGYAPGQV